MAFPTSFLEEVRGRLRLADIVGRRVKLQRQGRDLKGLCPFHNEKTPSFHVVEDKGFYHCFGCGAHGDAFKFVMETEGLDFREAVTRLAEEAGVPVPRDTPADTAEAARRATLAEAMALAQSWYAAALTGPEGAPARAYLAQRGISAEAIRVFGLGYAPPRGLIAHLAGRGVPLDLAIAAGLAGQGEGDRGPYDFFRHRLTIPIRDPRGAVIAFGARALSPEAKPKYLNSPDTPLFEKSRVLYNLDLARKPAFARREILVAEGYLDVIALSGAGFHHAVAPLGTALTEAQLQLLWRVAPEPVLCFDGDAAGIRAAQRAAERALPLLRPGHSLSFAFLPRGLDPDDLIRTQGAPAMQQVLAGAVPLVRVLWAKLVTRADLSTPERRARMEADVRAAVGTITDPTVRSHYAREMEQRMAQAFGGGAAPRGRTLPRRWPEARGGPKPGRREAGPPPIPPGPDPVLRQAGRRGPATGAAGGREELLTLLLVRHPWLIEPHYEHLARLEFTAGLAAQVVGALLGLAAEGQALDRDTVSTHLACLGLDDRVAQLAAQPEYRYLRTLDTAAAPDEVAACFTDALARHRGDAVIKDELRRALADWVEQPTAENMARISDLQRLLGPDGPRSDPTAAGP